MSEKANCEAESPMRTTKMNSGLLQAKELDKIVKSSVKPYVRGSIFNVQKEPEIIKNALSIPQIKKHSFKTQYDEQLISNLIFKDINNKKDENPPVIKAEAFPSNYESIYIIPKIKVNNQR